MTVSLAAVQPAPIGAPCPATDGARPGSVPCSETADGAVAALWKASWTQLHAVCPDLEIRLAHLEKARPTRFRALQRLEASAGRSAGRVLRGEAKPAALLTKLWAWEAAIVAELSGCGSRRGCGGQHAERLEAKP